MIWVKYSTKMCIPLNKLSKSSKIIKNQALELRVTTILSSNSWVEVHGVRPPEGAGLIARTTRNSTVGGFGSTGPHDMVLEASGLTTSYCTNVGMVKKLVIFYHWASWSNRRWLRYDHKERRGLGKAS
jgi:hypothetical protein